MRISDWSSDVCSSDLGSRDPGKSSSLRSRPHPALRATSLRAPALRSAQGVQACASQWLASSTPSPRFAGEGLRRTSPSPACGRRWRGAPDEGAQARSEEHPSELQSLMRISYAVFCLKKKTNYTTYREPSYTTNAIQNRH